MEMRSESLTRANLDEVVAFVRRSNPFAQMIWGWDAGRFVDWRWGTNTLFETATPGWFSQHCRLFRDKTGVRAVSVAEYGEDDVCILTGSEDREAVEYALAWLLDHRRTVRLDCAEHAEWLRPILTAHGFRESVAGGVEWEFDLQVLREDGPVPGGFIVRSLTDEPTPDYAGIAACIRSAFASDFDFEPGLLSLEENPLFRPELSLFVRSPDGRIAAYCRGTVDPSTGVAGIDPVCCHPDFQRRGLSTAVVLACFRAQRRVGGRFCYIGSGREPAPGSYLYRSLGPSRVTGFTSWAA